jgi:2-C-methyl-D-erythritol 4-phosphate cytidylyltransferase / 2-C-methyl-D-erythritol 2,4-cyclodiphosphate synthase
MPIHFNDSTSHLAEPPSPSVYAIVPAGGSGSRVGADKPKQYLDLLHRNGKNISVIEETVSILLACPSIAGVIVVVAPDDTFAHQVFAKMLATSGPRVELLFEGGATRRDSVLAGCRHIKHRTTQSSTLPWCLVHDAARPGVTVSEVQALIEKLIVHPVGGLLATPLADTIKQADVKSRDTVQLTLDRSLLWAAQTPQMFLLDTLLAALEKNDDVTDEASAIEALGLSPLLVEGSRKNFKITTQEDLAIMRELKMTANKLHISPATVRIGQGFDSHPLVPGRPLILGGVNIPCDRGLLGHSDADALLHAITDAILGATGKGDIGRWFPDTSASYAGADSAELLRTVIAQISAEGWTVGNIDATIIAQSPKLEPYMVSMVEKIASVLAVGISQVNVKAKTNEKLGHLGRGEAIAVHAVAMMFKQV